MKTLDIDLIKKYSHEDKEFLKDILTIFIEEISSFIQQIPHLSSTENWPEIFYLTERLSDISAYCGTERIDHFARAAYQALKANNFVETKNHLNNLVKEMEISLQAAKKLKEAA